MDCRGTSVRSAWISDFYSSNRMDNYVPLTWGCNALRHGDITVNNVRSLCIRATNIKVFIVGGCIRSCFQAIGTSAYGSNYIVCFNYFLIVGVRYISYRGFQTKFYKLVVVIVYARLKIRRWFIAKTQLVQYHWGLGIFYTETVGS
jgi:hypothetical protein